MNDKIYPKFVANDNKGFTLTFKNSMTISVQWGIMNYCSNKGSTLYNGGHRAFTSVTAITAEIMIWDARWPESPFNFGSDEVKGHVDTDEVAQWIHMASICDDMEDLYALAKQYRMLEV